MAVAADSQCAQYVLFVARLNLFPSQRRATLASDCLERDDVVFTQALDGAVYRSRNSFSHADVMRDLVGDAPPGRQAHQSQVLLHLLIVHDFQKGRLLKLDGEPLAQRPSNTGSLVVFMKSARTMVSLSVSSGGRWK
jgi:hypothetical protein